MKNVFYLSGFGYNKRVEKKESVRITAQQIVTMVTSPVDLVSSHLIKRWGRRIAM